MHDLTNPWVIFAIYFPAIFAFALGWSFLNRATDLCKKQLKDIDFDKEDEREYKVVSEETAKEIDEALGLVTVSTKITRELYDRTVLRMMQDLDFVSPAALRAIIEDHDKYSWVQISSMEDPEYPAFDELVLGYSQTSGDYVHIAYTEEQCFMLVDENDHYRKLPENIVISHWQHIEFLD